MKLIPAGNILVRTPLQSLQWAYDRTPRPTILFEEGLYLSSPEYWQEYLKKDSLQGKSREKLDRTFTKYWLRSCTRCTPYASFAGCTLADITDEDTSIRLLPDNSHIRRVRLDMNYMTQIIQAISKIPEILQQLKFYPNNSIYEVATGFRYVEYTIQDNTRHYQLTSIVKTPYLQSLLALANKGATPDALRDLLMREENVTREEADDFIMELWQSQLLVSELEPAVTGPEPLDHLVNQLSTLRHTEGLLAILQRIQGAIQDPGTGIGYYQDIEKELKKLDIAIEIPKNTLQVDLFFATQDCRFNKDLVNTIVSQAQDLMTLARKVQNTELNNFRTRFNERYENAEVPLSIALDADLGVGYSSSADELAGGNTLINDLRVGPPGTAARTANPDYIGQYTLTKYCDYLQHDKPFITITEEELSGFKTDSADCRFPNSMYMMGSLLKKEGRLDPDNFVFDMGDFGGPSAGNLLGRFTSGDKKLCAFTKELLQSEEQDDPDTIYAEIAHLPQARIGNILLRPLLRRYEIPYVGKSAADIDDLIPVEDLVVSIQNDEILLKSKKHNKRVIPRLTTAHNFVTNSLPIYRFLCHLQFQGFAHPKVWDWGQLSKVKHLPRVVYKNLIVKKAQWRIDEKDIAGLPKETSGYADYFSAFCAKEKLPKRVVYVEHDNDLLIDFGQEGGINIFLHYLKRHKNILLEEFLDTPENCIVQGADGEGHTNELIIPIQVSAARTAAVGSAGSDASAGVTGSEGMTISEGLAGSRAIPATGQGTGIQRKFGPGSPWLYFKVYCGTKTAEIILKQFLLPFAENGMREALFEKFFFIRYKDEFSHLRIRFFNRDTDKQGAVQKAFMVAILPFLDSSLVDKVVIDTYVRELERYGADMIPDAEQLFFADSIAVLRFMNLIEGAEGEKYRLLFALRGIDMLLDDFGLTLPDKQSLLKAMQATFFKEFGADPFLQKQLNEKYRERQADIFSHMNRAADEQNGIGEAAGIFRTRSEMNRSVIENIFSGLHPAKKRERLFLLLHSLVHLFMNRLFVAQQRKYELVGYHFLEKYYTSQIALVKKKDKAVME
jgi:class I lanthipeptide synthase